MNFKIVLCLSFEAYSNRIRGETIDILDYNEINHRYDGNWRIDESVVDMLMDY